MPYLPGDSLVVAFTTASATGQSINADSLPTALLAHNGTDDGSVTVTVSNVGTGRYKASCTIPSGYAGGDSVALVVFATISSIATAQVAYTDGLARPTVTLSSGDETKLTTAAGYTVPSAATIAAAVMASVVDGSITLAQGISIIGAATAGISAGQSTTSPSFRNMANTKVVITGTLDTSGDRTAITLTP